MADTDATVDLLISQWASKPRMRALANALLDAKRKGILEPLEYLERNDDLNQAKGVWLDYIGQHLGLRRPAVDSTAYTDHFGFDDAGVAWDSARYDDSESLPALSPAGDDLYRRLIRARGWALLSMGQMDPLVQAAREVDPSAVTTDGYDMTVAIKTERRSDMELARDTKALPVVAGVGLRILDSDTFGFDDSGVGFDLGRYE